MALTRIAALLEIKTASKASRLIKKEAAFAVLQKATDYDEELARTLPAKIAETLYPLEISVEGGEVSGR